MADRIIAHGKQLMLDGAHLADVIDEDKAAALALLLNAGVIILPNEEELRAREALYGR